MAALCMRLLCDHRCSEVGKFAAIAIALMLLLAIITISFVADTVAIVAVYINADVGVVVCKCQSNKISADVYLSFSVTLIKS